MIESALFILSAITLAVIGVLAFIVAAGQRTIAFLADQKPPDPAGRPRVTVIVAARNEERNIEQALRSMLAQDYGNIEFIVIDDRSTDATGAILDRLAAHRDNLRIIHLTELPEGWLGKNHALWMGAGQATGEILLFTDADVVMHPSVVARAVGRMQAHGLDHVTAVPEADQGTVLTRLLILTFGIYFNLFIMPWWVRNPRLGAFAGIGAFNMVRRSAYEAVGGHRAIAMRPDDDIKLGKLLKRAGRRQEYLYGRGMLAVEWYSTTGEMIRGLTKNAFAGVEYSVTMVLAATVFLLGGFVWPWVAPLIVAGGARWLNAMTALVLLLLCYDTTRFHASRPRFWPGFFLPVGTVIFVYIIWRSMVLVLWHGGIEWRGTHYPLDKLKANRI